MYGIPAPQSLPAAKPATRPLVTSADIDEVMLEQLEYLIEHVSGVICGCSRCNRYLRVRELLMEPFDHTLRK